MNRDEDGREVDSFGAIAQHLGAKGVIATLWSVNDSSTALLMQELYQVRQKTGMPKGEALRLAQEAMLSGKLRAAATGAKGWSHPFYWAPFILIGNWK
jgi:CHAT domain-containing protein